MISLPRELLKWLGGLKLSFPLEEVFPQISSGLLACEVWCHYFPHHVNIIPRFTDASERSSKLDTWRNLIYFFENHGFVLPWKSIEGAVDDNHAAAVDVLRALHDFCGIRQGILKTRASPTSTKMHVIAKGPQTHSSFGNDAVKASEQYDEFRRNKRLTEGNTSEYSRNRATTKSPVGASAFVKISLQDTTLSMMRHTMPRNLLQWLGSLNLSAPLRDVPCCVSNGVLIAEICERYFPKERSVMGTFSKVSAYHLKLDNWIRLMRFLPRCGVFLSREIVELVVNGDNRAIVTLLSQVHAALAKEKIEKETKDIGGTFSEIALCRPSTCRVRSLRNARGEPASYLDADIRGDDGRGQPSSIVMSLSSPELLKARTSIASPIEFARRVREADTLPCEYPPLASSSRRTWRSVVRSRNFATPTLPGGDAARYPWVGGSPWK